MGDLSKVWHAWLLLLLGFFGFVVMPTFLTLDGCNGPDHSCRDKVTNKRYIAPYTTMHYAPPMTDGKGRITRPGYWYTIHHPEQHIIYTAEHGGSDVGPANWPAWEIGDETIVDERLGYWTGWVYTKRFRGPVKPAAAGDRWE